MSDPTSPKRAAFDWVIREFDPKGFNDALLTALDDVAHCRVAERAAYRAEAEAALHLAEVEAEAAAPHLVNTELPNAPAREKAAKAAAAKDPEVLKARKRAREAQQDHDSAEAAFEAAERRFKALSVLGGLNTAILRFLGSVA